MATYENNSNLAPTAGVEGEEELLEGLLEESLLNAPFNPEAGEAVEVAEPNELDELDALMSESMEAVGARKKLKDARAKQKRGGLSPKEQAENEAWLARWEMQNIWKPVANVAMYKAMKCVCGRKQTIFHQLLQRQAHRHSSTTQRWIDVEVVLTRLPNEIVVQKWDTPQCTNCAPLHGFDFTKGVITEWEGN